MGCDIHVFVEEYEQGQWFYLPEYKDFYDHRSYTAFGLLAGVRDYNPTPIVEPRGFPIDASPEVKDYYGWTDSDSPYSWSDYHSATWYDPQELVDYDWEQPVTSKYGDDIPALDLFPEYFFTVIGQLARRGNCRIIMYFDS